MGSAVISVVCWGELLWDLFPETRRLGGALANVAYHLAAFGDRAKLVSRVGDDVLGREAIAELARRGVDTGLVGVDPAAPTGTVRVELNHGEPRYRVAAQAAWDHIECTQAVAEAVRVADAVVYGTLAQRTALGGGALARALDFATPNTLLVCDLNVRQPFVTGQIVDRALAHARVVKLNDAEARLVASLFGVGDALEWLLEKPSVELIALTRGARGSVLATREGRLEHPGVPVDPSKGDRVGAGDAFTARLVHDLTHGTTALDALSDHANHYAAHVASETGAMPPLPEQCGR